MASRMFWIAAIAAPSLAVLAMRGGDDAPAPAVAAPSPAARVIAVRDRSDAVRGELPELRADVAELRAKPSPREELPLEERIARAERRNAERVDRLAAAFAADRRDPSWSPDAERRLHDAFAGAAVAGGRLEDLACSSTMCRYSVLFESLAQREAGLEAITRLARWDSHGFGRPAPDEPRRFVFYVSREGTDLPLGE